MHQPLALLLPLCLLCGCELVPTMAEPKIQVAPYLSEYSLRGKTAMDTVSSGTVTHHAEHPLRDFGVGAHEDDFGIRGDIGNGFAGLRLDYYRMSASTSRRTTLGDGWGRVQGGDLAGMNTVMDEFRVGYAQEVVREKFDFHRLQDVQFRLAPGVVLAHRDLSLDGFEDTRARSQSLNASDNGVVYPALRARLQYQEVALDVEYAISPPGFDFGGDFKGTSQDFETRLSYEFEMHDVEVFVAYRHSSFQVNGSEDGQNYTGDFVLDGLQVGMRVGF